MRKGKGGGVGRGRLVGGGVFPMLIVGDILWKVRKNTLKMLSKIIISQELPNSAASPPIRTVLIKLRLQYFSDNLR